MPQIEIRRAIRRAFNLPGWEAIGRRAFSAQWRHFFPALTLRERLIVFFGILLILSGSGLFLGRFYLRHTDTVPAAGGTLTVGIVGQPLYINPVLASSNQTDATLVHLVFAGLFRYDASGMLTPDLATEYAVGDFGKTVDVTLQDNLTWPDGQAFTADDVVFTVNAIKNPAMRSPLFTTWIGINAEALDSKTVRFTLPAPYPPFLNNLTLGILPQHIWENVAPEKFALSDQNLKPMGLGPFRPARFERTKDGRILSYRFERNSVSPTNPLLDQITFRFYEQTGDAIAAFNSGETRLLIALSADDAATIRNGASLQSALLPRTFSLFFNQSTVRILTDKTIRQTLSYATDRNPIIEALGGAMFAKILERPIPEGALGATTETDRYDFAPEHAKNVLEAAGWHVGDDGIRTKGTDRLALTLTVPENDTMKAVAGILQSQWRDIGIAMEIKTLGPDAYRHAVANRDYDVLLAGQEFPVDPDPYAFWHSSQKFDPGGNIALYSNPKADAVLETSRGEFDDTARAAAYTAFQQILMQDVPAIFLWQSATVSAADPTLRGANPTFIADPSWQFGNAAEWYVQTKRVWK